jgi:hypothetical protein
LAVHTGPANERDDQAAPATVKAIPKIKAANGQLRRPEVLQGDRGYGFEWLLLLIVRWLIRPLIAPRGSEHGSGLGKTRYVVERTLSWMGHYRRVRCCYEKTPEHFQAFNTLMACAILARRLRTVRRRRSRVLK